MNFRILTILFLAVTTVFFSCNKKNNDVVGPLDINPPHVNTINATADTINIYQNGVRQNNLSSIFPGGATSYLNFINGTQVFSVKRTNTTNVLLSQSYTIHSLQYYSIFVTGTSSGDMFETVDAIDTAESVIADSANNSNDNISMVRFVNASANSGAVSVTVNTASANFGNINYAGSTAFVPFNAAQIDEVKIFLGNSSTPKIDSMFTFQTGAIYTLYTRGSLTSTGNNAFAISLAVDPFIQQNQ